MELMWSYTIDLYTDTFSGRATQAMWVGNVLLSSLRGTAQFHYDGCPMADVQNCFGLICEES